METEYIEACIAALPEEKRLVARRAFQELLSDGSDENLLVRLLLVFEATSTFAAAVPAAIATAIRQGVDALDARLRLLADSASASEAERRREIELLAEHLRAQSSEPASFTKIVERLESQRVSIDRVAASVNRMRHTRIGSVLSVALLTFLGGAAILAGAFYHRYKDAVAYRDFFHSMRSRGVDVSVGMRGNDYMVRVEGGPVQQGTVWIKDAAGNTVGAEIYFSQP